MTKIKAIGERVTDLEAKLIQVDKQSRCRHVWEPSREDHHVWRCADCGCIDLKGH